MRRIPVGIGSVLAAALAALTASQAHGQGTPPDAAPKTQVAPKASSSTSPTEVSPNEVSLDEAPPNEASPTDAAPIAASVPTATREPEPRPWRVSLGLGNAWVNSNPLRSLLQNGSMDATGLNIDWQPTAIGLRLGVGFLASDESHGGVASHYRSTELQLAATYALPLPPPCVQVILFAGPMQAWQHLELSDGSVNLSSASVDTGGLAGIDVATPPLAGWSFLVRLYASEQKVKFSQFDFSHNFVERALLIGGSYAF